MVQCSREAGDEQQVEKKPHLLKQMEKFHEIHSCGQQIGN